jgi:hypothetical protein
MTGRRSTGSHAIRALQDGADARARGVTIAASFKRSIDG